MQFKLTKILFYELDKWNSVYIPKCSIRQKNRVIQRMNHEHIVCTLHQRQSNLHSETTHLQSDLSIFHNLPIPIDQNPDSNFCVAPIITESDCELPPLDDLDDLSDSIWIEDDQMSISADKLFTSED